MKIFNRTNNSQLGREHEKPEFPKGRLGVVICKECRAVYYKKSWRHDKPENREGETTLSICPACKMIGNGQFEGEIKIIGLPEKMEKDFFGLVHNSGRQAIEKDPLDRIIKIEKLVSETIRILMTENQSAVRLAKKIKSTFKAKNLKIAHSPSPNETVYIVIGF